MNEIGELIDLLKCANTIAILTGAGVSAESGIATFRDPDGLWSKFNPAELASIDGFMANPELVWEWYQYRVDIVNKAQPNDGHLAIAEMQNIFKDVRVVTQNVDRLHQRAGAKGVIELHGNIVTNRCFDCSKEFSGVTNLGKGKLPECSHCGGKIRPNVVWFGEELPQDAISEAEIAASECSVLFSIGTSSEVYPAANLPYIAKQNGAKIIEVNPNETKLSNHADLVIRDNSGSALKLILKEYKKKRT